MSDTDEQGSPFSKTTLWVVVTIAIVSLITTVVLTVLGNDPGEQTSAGSDGYSTSAIGHRALVELLGKLDVPVVVSRNNSADKAKSGLLIIAEPKATESGRETERLRVLIENAPNILVVLPKWYGFVGRKKEWIEAANAYSTAEVAAILGNIGLDASAESIARTYLPVMWKSREGLPLPSLKNTQSIDAKLVEAVIDNGETVLLGHFEHNGKRIWVLADPDVLNNAGLRKPENAQFAIALIDRLRDGGSVVFDETVHGHAQAPSLLRVLFTFPLVLATIQVLICAVLAMWAAMVRFGPRRTAAPPLAPGKDFLIANTAALLRFGGHHVDALQRYLQANVATVKHALHAPELGPSALYEWLERVRQLRGGAISLRDLEKQVGTASAQPQRVVELADLVYRWRMEMIHGSHHRS